MLLPVAAVLTSFIVAKAVGPASVIPTFTMKCDAAARPMTLERKDMGRTSAPYLYTRISTSYGTLWIVEYSQPCS
jgi:hypothetical protein